MTYNPFTLEGKTILVTGASSGIGKATAIECSKMGARLIITGRNAERLGETSAALEGEGHKAITCDLVQEADIETLINTIEDKLDGVVLCAGRSLSLPFQFCTREKFDNVFGINFFSPVELLRMLSKKKKLGSGCSVVFMVSIGGTKKFGPGNSVYGAAKAALSAMVHFCAVELAPKKVRVNGVNPGMVETPMIHKGEVFTNEQLQADMQTYPLKRYGTPNDIAHGVIYLLSDASSWVTGHSLVIDGGKTAR